MIKKTDGDFDRQENEYLTFQIYSVIIQHL